MSTEYFDKWYINITAIASAQWFETLWALAAGIRADKGGRKILTSLEQLIIYALFPSGHQPDTQ